MRSNGAYSKGRKDCRSPVKISLPSLRDCSNLEGDNVGCSVKFHSCRHHLCLPSNCCQKHLLHPHLCAFCIFREIFLWKGAYLAFKIIDLLAHSFLLSALTNFLLITLKFLLSKDRFIVKGLPSAFHISLLAHRFTDVLTTLIRECASTSIIRVCFGLWLLCRESVCSFIGNELMLLTWAILSVCHFLLLKSKFLRGVAAILILKS